MTSFYRPIVVDGLTYTDKSATKRGGFEYFDDMLDKDLFNYSILDLGAGSGGLSFHLAGRIKSATSVDHSDRSDLGEWIREQNDVENITFVKQEMWDFLEDNTECYDVVFLLNILHWIENPKHILDEVDKCCNKYIVIETPRTVIPHHKNGWTTETYLKWYKDCSIRKYSRPPSCDGPRDGLIIDIGKSKAHDILYQRAEGWRDRPDRDRGSGGLVYRGIDRVMEVYEGEDKKIHNHSRHCKFGAIENIPVKKILNDGSWYMGQKSEDMMDKYAEEMKQGDIFPPIIVYRDKDYYRLVDGSHRHRARKKYFTTINAIVLEEEIKEKEKE